jgi:hypothetical protein
VAYQLRIWALMGSYALIKKIAFSLKSLLSSLLLKHVATNTFDFHIFFMDVFGVICKNRP